MNATNQPPYDLNERTYDFALRIRLLLKQRIWHRVSWTDVSQLLRSSGSVAANYRESQKGISPADFVYRIRISRKETRESNLWLRLIADTNDLTQDELEEHGLLLNETDELARIFTSIIRKREQAS